SNPQIISSYNPIPRNSASIAQNGHVPEIVGHHRRNTQSPLLSGLSAVGTAPARLVSMGLQEAQLGCIGPAVGSSVCLSNNPIAGSERRPVVQQFQAMTITSRVRWCEGPAGLHRISKNASLYR
ncbi:hypothetical protein QTH97_35820, partial [Variovorax sp. J22R24]|uniref:hypothetical protein n=1 Tax=Variovorax gracilis TaxID=3053502 RepID=UPI0025756B20